MGYTQGTCMHTLSRMEDRLLDLKLALMASQLPDDAVYVPHKVHSHECVSSGL